MQRKKTFEDRFQRILEAAGIEKDADLARVLGIKPQSIAAARKREQIPSGWVEKIADKFDISADWLFFGEGPMHRKKVIDAFGSKSLVQWRSVESLSESRPVPSKEFDLDRLTSVIEIVEETLEFAKRSLPPRKKAELIAAICDLYADTETQVDPAKVLRLVKFVA